MLENTDKGSDPPPAVFSWSGSLLLLLYADSRTSDDVIAF